MNYGGLIVTHMESLLLLFKKHSAQPDGLDTLLETVRDKALWRRGHALFSAARTRTLNAEKSNDPALLQQCLFEEVCAMTLYNLCEKSDAFDPDSPYWIVPNALTLAKRLGVGPQEVVELVA